MKLKLVIDHREPDKLLELIEKTCSEYVLVERKNLSFGDFQFLKDDDGECQAGVLMVIERKTKADLLSSVNDGRYRNQKQTLLENVERSKIYYILEEGGELVCDETILGCAISMMVRDGFKIIQTGNIEETAKFIAGLCKRFSKNYEKYFGHAEGDGSLNIVKRRQVPSSNDVFLNMIMQVPGLSDKSARVICDKYPSLSSIYSEYSGMDPIKRVDTLRNATPVGCRKISKTAIENLVKVLFEEK